MQFTIQLVQAKNEQICKRVSAVSFLGDVPSKIKLKKGVPTNLQLHAELNLHKMISMICSFSYQLLKHTVAVL
jgi:hypothetical protein